MPQSVNLTSLPYGGNLYLVERSSSLQGKPVYRPPSPQEKSEVGISDGESQTPLPRFFLSVGVGGGGESAHRLCLVIFSERL